MTVETAWFLSIVGLVLLLVITGLRIGFKIQNYIVETILLVMMSFTWGLQGWYIALLLLIGVMLVAIRIDATNWYLKTGKRMSFRDVLWAIGLVVISVIVFYLGRIFAS